jgi:hypothetical protein
LCINFFFFLSLIFWQTAAAFIRFTMSPGKQ